MQKDCNCQQRVAKMVVNNEVAIWLTYHLLCGNQQIVSCSYHYFCQSCSYIFTNWLICIWVTFLFNQLAELDHSYNYQLLVAMDPIFATWVGFPKRSCQE